jgi:hypothetical protein
MPGAASPSNTGTSAPACSAVTIAGTWSTSAGQPSDASTARIRTIQYNLGVTGANGTFASTGEVYPSHETLTFSVGLETVGNLNTGKANTLFLEPYAVPLQVVPVLRDGSEGSPVWTANVTGGPTTVQPYEMAANTVSWNETDCHGNAATAGTYRLRFSGRAAGGYVPMSGSANGTPFNGTFGAYPYYVDFSIR